MKNHLLFLAFTLCLTFPATSFAWSSNLDSRDPNAVMRAMQDHPVYDDSYYDKRTNVNPYQDRDDYNDAKHGSDIRDYNPYYDRYGNLKRDSLFDN